MDPQSNSSEHPEQHFLHLIAIPASLLAAVLFIGAIYWLSMRYQETPPSGVEALCKTSGGIYEQCPPCPKEGFCAPCPPPCNCPAGKFWSNEKGCVMTNGIDTSTWKTYRNDIEVRYPGKMVQDEFNDLGIFKNGGKKDFIYQNEKLRELLFVLSWTNGDFNFRVLGPEGEVIHGKDLGRGEMRIEIKGARAGVWTIEVEAENITDGEKATLSVFVYDPEDDDRDGIMRTNDNCPVEYNPNQEDIDKDGVGDVCDNCVNVPNPTQIDNFPIDGPEGPGNGRGDACENLPADMDEDGYLNTIDNCPYVPNKEQEDVDADGVGDMCDNCPPFSNADQRDSNRNGIGDVCEA